MFKIRSRAFQVSSYWWAHNGLHLNGRYWFCQLSGLTRARVCRNPQNSSLKGWRDSQKMPWVPKWLLVLWQSLLAAHTGGPSRTCCSPTMFRLWPRRPSGQLVLQQAEITLLPLCTGSTKGVYFLGSQESENVAQNKVGVQVGQDVPAGPGKIPKSLSSYILSLSILLQ